MKKKSWKAWTVIQDDNRGWDNLLGSMSTPHVFWDITDAVRYIKEESRLTKPRLNTVQVVVTLDV